MVSTIADRPRQHQSENKLENPLKDSSGRRLLQGRLRELLPLLRPENGEARLLDQISSAEILDLTYLQGGAFDSAFAAHAQYPVYVEQVERNTVPSPMSVTFPILVNEERTPKISVVLRCADR